MSEAIRCDRCGTVFGATCRGRVGWATRIKADLCMKCQESLNRWFKERAVLTCFHRRGEPNGHSWEPGESCPPNGPVEMTREMTQ